jgi:hypothetical protein
VSQDSTGEVREASAVQTDGVTLPASADASPGKPSPDLSAPPRLRTADRQQLLSPMLIDDLIEPDHPARRLAFRRGTRPFCPL